VAEFARVDDGVEAVREEDAGAPFLVCGRVVETEEGHWKQGLHKRETDSPDIILKGIDWTLGPDLQGEKRRENFSAFERLGQKSLPPTHF